MPVVPPPKEIPGVKVPSAYTLKDVPPKFMLVADAAPSVGVVNDIFVAAIPDGSVELIEGTPPLDVINTPLLAVARAAITLALEAYRRVLIAFVAG